MNVKSITTLTVCTIVKLTGAEVAQIIQKHLQNEGMEVGGDVKTLVDTSSGNLIDLRDIDDVCVSWTSVTYE